MRSWEHCFTRPVPDGRGRSGLSLVPENVCVFLPNQRATNLGSSSAHACSWLPAGLWVWSEIQTAYFLSRVLGWETKRKESRVTFSFLFWLPVLLPNKTQNKSGRMNQSSREGALSLVYSASTLMFLLKCKKCLLKSSIGNSNYGFIATSS